MQRTLKSLLQHHNSKASILQHSTFFITQLSHLYMATGKTIALTIWTMVSSKVLSLLFRMLSRFLIALLPRSKQTSFNFMVAVAIHIDFGAQDNKVCHCLHFFTPSVCLEVMGQDTRILVLTVMEWVAIPFSRESSPPRGPCRERESSLPLQVDSLPSDPSPNPISSLNSQVFYLVEESHVLICAICQSLAFS